MGYEPTEDEMISIPIAEFLAADILPVDLFIRLSNEKYVMIAKRDSKNATSQLLGMEAKNVAHLHVRAEDYSRYVVSSVSIAGVMITQRDIATSRKADFLTRASSAALQEVRMLGMSVDAYENVRQVASATTTLVEARADLFSLLSAFEKISTNHLAHSVATSVLSAMVARGLGWTKPATIEKVALGGLLHDIGLKEMPPEMLNKARAEFTYEELQLYETHPFRSMEILRSIPSAAEDVIAIAYEHHENAIGLGYPRKLRDMRMHPMAKVVALVDAFCELTLPGNPHMKALTPSEAVAHIEITMGQPFNRECFTALKLLVQRDVGKIAG